MSARFSPLLLLSLLLFTAGCDSNKIFDKNKDIPKYIWNISYKPEFKVEIKDTSLLYNVYVNVRHTQYFTNSNLWILITTQFPDGKKLHKRVNLELADVKGKWYGDCLGDICDVRVPIQQNAYFDQAGEYTFQYEQIMRTDNLPFVMSMGLRVEKAGEKMEINAKPEQSS